jgi:hypothetical protein
MLCKGVLQEMISKALDLDVGDVLRVPEEAISNIFFVNIEVNLALRKSYIDED